MLLKAAYDPISRHLERLDEPTTMPQLVQARDAHTLFAATRAGVNQMAALVTRRALPDALRAGLALASQHWDALSTPLQGACSELERNAQRVAALRLPAGALEEFLAGARAVVTEGHEASLGAIGGAAIGSIILPGIGTAIGGAVGAWLGNSQAQKREAAIVEDWNRSWMTALQAVDSTLDRAWDVVVDGAHRQGLVLYGSDYCDRAHAAWSELWDRIVAHAQPGQAHPLRDELGAFLTRWGPHPEALHVFVRISMRPYQDVDELAHQAAEFGYALFPEQEDAIEDRADVAFARGDLSAALATAREGVALHPRHQGLCLTLVQCLAASGEHRELDHAIDRFEPLFGRLVTLSQAYGLIYAHRSEAAAALLRAWAAEDATWPVDALSLMDDPTLRTLFDSGLVPTPTMNEYVNGLVVRHMPIDPGKQRFYGLPPGTVGQRAAWHLFNHRPGEDILYYLGADDDDGAPNEPAVGLGITTGGVVWRELWDDGVCTVAFAHVDPDTVSVDGATVKLGSTEILSALDAETAAALAEVVRQAAIIGRC